MDIVASGIIPVVYPVASKYQGLENFNKITLAQKLMALFLTFLASVATLCIATIHTFRAIVWHYYKQLHPIHTDQLPPPLDPVDPALPADVKTASSSHTVALCTMSVEALLKALQKGSRGVHSYQRFQTGPDIPAKIVVNGEETSFRVFGNCIKATVEMENSTPRYAYIVDAHLFNGSVVMPIKGAFLSPHNALDIKAIGHLCFEKMKQNQFPLMKFRNTAPLPDSVIDLLLRNNTVLQSNLAVDTLTEEEKETQKAVKEANQCQADALEAVRAADPQDLIDAVNSEKIRLGLDESACNLIPYILNFFNELKSEEENEAQNIKDRDYITFTNEKIAKTEDEEEAKYSYAIFKLIFQTTFGIERAQVVFGRYMLNKKETITLLDLKKAMVGIAMLAGEKELRELFAHIKSDQPGNLVFYKVGNLLAEFNPQLYKQIQQRDRFEDLMPAEIDFLRKSFMTVPMSTKVSFLEVLNHLKPGSFTIDYLYGHDLEGLEEMEHWRNLDISKPNLAIPEYFGKALGYIEMEEGMLFPVPEIKVRMNDTALKPEYYIDPDASAQYYKVHGSLEKKNDAVIGHLLSPLNPLQDSIPSHPNTEHCFLIFRGTNIDKDALDNHESVARDLDPTGIGKQTFNNRKDDILSMVDNYLKDSQGRVSLLVTGHSLGGCDSQRALVIILEKIVSEWDKSMKIYRETGTKPANAWNKLKYIDLTTFNAPKPDPEVNRNLKKIIREIHLRNEVSSIKIDIKIKIDHVRFHDINYEDHLERQGDILLGVDYDGTDKTLGTPLKEAPFLKRQLTIMTMSVAGGVFDDFMNRHQYRPFNPEHKTMKKVVCDPSNPEHTTMKKVEYNMEKLFSKNQEQLDEMEEIMAYNYFYKPTGNVIQDTFKSVKWNLGYVGTAFFTAAQYALSSAHAYKLKKIRVNEKEIREQWKQRRQPTRC